MTGTELYRFMYDWVTGVLGSAVPVVRAYGDAQLPTTGTCVAIEDNVGWEPYGEATVGPIISGQRNLKHESVVTFNFWEIRGVGDNLRALRSNLDTIVTKQLFSDNNVGVLSLGPIQQIPELLQTTRWVRQYRMEAQLTVASLTLETAAAIETVETVANFIQPGG